MVEDPELERRLWVDLLVANSRATFGMTLLAPFWAAIFVLALSGPIPDLGVVPFDTSIWWVVAAACAALLRLSTDIAFTRTEALGVKLAPRIWLIAYGCCSTVVTAAWATGFWLLYVPDNLANNMLLMALMMGAVTQSTVSRSTHFAVAASMFAPMILLPVARMLMDLTFTGMILVTVYPAWVLLVLFHIRRTSKEILRTYRLRYENEALAQQLRRARDEALNQRKMAEQANRSKSSFLANMSHELRTPLNAIMGFSEIIEKDALGPGHAERYREYARDIHGSGHHLLSLINDLLDIAKIEAGRVELAPGDLCTDEVMEDSVTPLEPMAKAKDVSLGVIRQVDVPTLYADERALKQILFNLLSNAIKFTPPGGHVSLAVRRQGEGTVLSVTDDGIGIPKDQLDRLFLPFEQLENAYGKSAGGTGLGLTLVKSLTELHQGDCRIQSEVGEGTVVEIWLPDEPLPAKDEASHEPQPDAYPELSTTPFAASPGVF